MIEQWGAVIEGHPLNLSEAFRCFGDASLSSLRVGTMTTPSGKTLPAFFAQAFASLTDDGEVHREAERVLALLNGMLFVIDPARDPLKIASIHRHGPNRWSGGVLFMPGKAQARSKATAIASGGTPVPLADTPEVHWMDLALAVDEVRNVLFFLRAPEPDWFDLYKVGELLESAAGQPWWPKFKFNDFTCSAQFDRHARGAHEGMRLDRRMSLPEARSFIRDIARRWLLWWTSDEAGAREASQQNVRRRRKADERSRKR
jgi:hypothetical protein